MALASGNKHGFDADEPEEENFKRLTAQEAQELRESDPALSPWWVVGLQCVAGLAVALVAWGVSGKASVGWSAGYGALAVSIAMIALAPRLVADLSWLALLVGLLVTLKMYWLALLKRPKPKQI